MDDALPARLATNLERLRRERRMTQGSLAKAARVPRSTLAHLESGRGNPSLSNLAALSGALQVSIEELLARPRADVELRRKQELPRTERGHGSVTTTRLLPDALAGLQLERMEIRPGGFMRGVPHLPGTKEYLTCLSGSVRLSVAGSDYLLSPGDVIAFPGDQHHAYHNPGRTAASALSLVAFSTGV